MTDLNRGLVSRNNAKDKNKEPKTIELLTKRYEKLTINDSIALVFERSIENNEIIKKFWRHRYVVVKSSNRFTQEKVDFDYSEFSNIKAFKKHVLSSPEFNRENKSMIVG